VVCSGFNDGQQWQGKWTSVWHSPQQDGYEMAISAFVLIDTTGNHTKSAYKTITRIQGVKAVYPVTGPFDLIAQVEAETLEELNDLVMVRLRGIDGVTKTNTAIVLDL
jgi:DNA-binding Lrp family transcriptional regulator